MTMRRLLSTEHTSKHSASAAENEHGKKISGNLPHSLIHDQRNHDQNEEIQSPQQKPPEEFSVSLSFPCQETCQKGDKDVDSHNTCGYHLFRQIKAIEQEGKEQQKPGGEQIGQEQAF